MYFSLKCGLKDVVGLAIGVTEEVRSHYRQELFISCVMWTDQVRDMKGCCNRNQFGCEGNTCCAVNGWKCCKGMCISLYPFSLSLSPIIFIKAAVVVKTCPSQQPSLF
jgi:hypothetical protein